MIMVTVLTRFRANVRIRVRPSAIRYVCGLMPTIIICSLVLSVISGFQGGGRSIDQLDGYVVTFQKGHTRLHAQA